MKRKEQIEQAKAELFPIGDNGRSYEQALSASGFDLGVKWADEHPKDDESISDNIRYCIDYVKPNKLYREDGTLNVRHFRTLSLHEAVTVLTIIKNFGGKFIDLYRGNVKEGKLAEWNPLPMIVNNDEDFYTVGEFDSYYRVKDYLGIAFMHYLDSLASKGKMCLSNMECADIDKAFNEQDWAKIERYIIKYREYNALEGLFPELKESEDERIRQSIIADIKSRLNHCTHTMDDYYRQQIAWLEKQGEQKPLDYEHFTVIQKDFAPKKGGEV